MNMRAALRRFRAWACAGLLALAPCPAALAATADADAALPTAADLTQEGQRLTADQTLGDGQRQEELAILAQTGQLLGELQQKQDRQAELRRQLDTAPQALADLRAQLDRRQSSPSAPPALTGRDAAQLQQIYAEQSARATAAQQALNEATAALREAQTIPNRVPAAMEENATQRKAQSASLPGSPAPSAARRWQQAVSQQLLLQEQQWLQALLDGQSALVDLATFRVRLAELEYDYQQRCLKAVQARQNELLAAPAEDAPPALGDAVPELRSEVELNAYLGKLLQAHGKDAIKLTEQMHDVETALGTARQIGQSVTVQLQGVEKSLLLSRMLTRQQQELPQLAPSLIRDDDLTNLNLKLYDLREFRSKLLDPALYARELLEKTPTLAAHRDELLALLTQRREMLDRLNAQLSSELNDRISLRIKTREFTELKAGISATITENLFWLRSNPPLGRDLLANLLPALRYQWEHVRARLQAPDYLRTTAQTALILLLPLVLLSAVVLICRRRLAQAGNRLAARLDRHDDGFWVTPAALGLKLVAIMPAVVWRLCLGAIFICGALSDRPDQFRVLLMLMLHITVFVFFFEILKPNNLAQRHFCVPPAGLRRASQLLGQIWLAVIPILIVANIVETSPVGIFYDYVGYFILILCSLALVAIGLRRIRAALQSAGSLPLSLWAVALLGTAAAATMAIAVGSGYYYTTVKLVNRLAFTAYLGLGYWLLSALLRRCLYLVRVRLTQRNLHAAATRDYSLLHRLYAAGSRVGRLFNTALLCALVLLMYRQWSDLAGVLGYLDHVKLWEHRSVVDGREVIGTSLSLAEVLTAAIFLLLTWVLNRNLPALLERLTLLRRPNDPHGTGYTVKIMSSYLILALGTVCAAGALGITWDNLQWLVAALSVGLGFGLQEIFGNFVSGVIILFERQIRVGDIITLDDLSGTVSKIRIRSTTIISFENKEVMIPNKQFITSALTNWSLTTTVTKLEFAVGVAYDADLTRAKSLLGQIVARCPYLERSLPPLIYVAALGDSSITVQCDVYVSKIGARKLTYDYLSTETVRVFTAAGIEIPFNQLVVDLKHVGDEDLKAFLRRRAATPDQTRAEGISCSETALNSHTSTHTPHSAHNSGSM